MKGPLARPGLPFGGPLCMSPKSAWRFWDNDMHHDNRNEKI